MEEARGCLDDMSSIDVVAGEQPGACDPKCIVSPPEPDGGETTVYVSTMCPPLPAAPYDSSGSDARCARALALYQANVTCLADGGITGVVTAGDAAVADAANAGDAADAADAADAGDATAE
jgi:hypothetical protein